VVQELDVRAEDVNIAALLTLRDLTSHKHMRIVASFGYTAALSTVVGIDTPWLSFRDEIRVSVATIFGTDTSGTLGKQILYRPPNLAS
jgi:hypothetical protein